MPDAAGESPAVLQRKLAWAFVQRELLLRFAGASPGHARGFAFAPPPPPPFRRRGLNLRFPHRISWSLGSLSGDAGGAASPAGTRATPAKPGRARCAIAAARGGPRPSDSEKGKRAGERRPEEPRERTAGS